MKNRRKIGKGPWTSVCKDEVPKRNGEAAPKGNNKSFGGFTV